MSKLKLLGAFEIGLEAFICLYRQNGEKFAKGVVSSAKILLQTKSPVGFCNFYYPLQSPVFAASASFLIFISSALSALQKFQILLIF